MNKVAILNFGSQYTHLISRRARAAGVYADVLPANTTAKRIKDEGYDAVFLSGGPASIYEDGVPRADPAIYELGIPVLGICYGMQDEADRLGGKVIPGKVKEYGPAEILLVNNGCKLFKGLNRGKLRGWASHGDRVEPPADFEVDAFSRYGIVEAMHRGGIYGIQFHPEVHHTEKGQKIIDNFLFEIAGCEKTWTPKSSIKLAEKEIREKVRKKDRVLCYVSGGKDSAVAFKKVRKAVGNRVVGVYIDHGLGREGETDDLEKYLPEVKILDRSERFLRALEGKTDPEEKREIIGNIFAEIKPEIENELKQSGALVPGKGGRRYLAQGTLYPDRIESREGGFGSKNADKIKTHHNVGAPEIMKLRRRGLLIEPNQWSYKDEIEREGKELGLPECIVGRWPFPGPGLAIRHAGRVSYPKDGKIFADLLFTNMPTTSGYERVIYPVVTVGVQGDARTDTVMAMLGGKEIDDKDWKEKVRPLISCIVANGRINRVVYSLTDRKLSQDDMKNVREMPFSRETLYLLRRADAIATDTIKRRGYYDKISQFVTVLFAGPDGKPGVGLRDVKTPDYMTAEASEVPISVFYEIADAQMRDKEINKLGGLSRVVIDRTPKPPATIEWE
jgi:GMP synthase (glutamine-hydrolysing)